MEGWPSALSTNYLFTCLAACLLLFLTASATPVRYCDKQADYAIKVKGVEINPNPVVRGKPARFSISAVTADTILGAKLEIDVAFFGVHIHHENHELCDETSCPVSAGDFVISHNQVLPTFTPPGSYTLTMKMLGVGGNQLTCIMFNFKIRIGSPVADS